MQLQAFAKRAAKSACLFRALILDGSNESDVDFTFVLLSRAMNNKLLTLLLSDCQMVVKSTYIGAIYQYSHSNNRSARFVTLAGLRAIGAMPRTRGIPSDCRRPVPVRHAAAADMVLMHRDP